MAVFDLDPGAPAGMRECCQVALDLHEVLAAVGLEAFPKTSGSKGLQVYVPLNTPHSHDHAAGFTRACGQLLARQQPDRVLVEMTKSLRGGKVFVDWSQNSRHKTTIAVYSLRALARPTVSTPVSWDEVAAGADGAPLSFEAATCWTGWRPWATCSPPPPPCASSSPAPAEGPCCGRWSGRRRRDTRPGVHGWCVAATNLLPHAFRCCCHLRPPGGHRRRPPRRRRRARRSARRPHAGGPAPGIRGQAGPDAGPAHRRQRSPRGAGGHRAPGRGGRQLPCARRPPPSPAPWPATRGGHPAGVRGGRRRRRGRAGRRRGRRGGGGAAGQLPLHRLQDADQHRARQGRRW